MVDDVLAPKLRDFARRSPILLNDFASASQLNEHTPRIWAFVRAGEIEAAAIDDGVAMSVAGETRGLQALARELGSPAKRFIVSGPTQAVHEFMEAAGGAEGRRIRPEHCMAITAREILPPFEEVPIRVADEGDVPLLIPARVAALQDEYGIDVSGSTRVMKELRAAVERAVQARGVAVWIQGGKLAFTAQLIAKTPFAATFGDLYTDPALRGSGRATRALTAFCHWLLTESEHVALRVGVDNVPALRLYERVGFSVVGECLSSVDERAV